MSIKILLSSVSDEFLAYRDQLRSDLTRHNVEVKVQEDFKSYGGSTLDMLDQYIASCDAVVHLIGDMTGAAPPPTSLTAFLAKHPDLLEKLPPVREHIEHDGTLSYTQWEAWLALYHGKLLILAEADQAAPRGPNSAPTDASREAQRMHVERLRGHERYSKTFSSPDNLAKIILSSAILDLLTRAEQPRAFAVFRSFPLPAVVALLFLLLTTPLAGDQLAKWLGVSLATPFVLVGAAGGLVLALLYWRYFGILGFDAAASDSIERRAYNTLRESLVTGGTAVRLYARWLSAFLDAVDRFFGDADKADRTLFPHAFGLRGKFPLWTPSAFDRCLLLALIYPIVTIFLMWGVSGQVGPAEHAFNLPPDLAAWQRAVVFVVGALAVIAIWRYLRSKGFKSVIWICGPFIVAGVACAGRIMTGGRLWSDLTFLVTVFVLSSGPAFVVATIAAVVVGANPARQASRNVALNIAGSVSIAFQATFGLFLLAGEGSNYDGVIAAALALAGAFTGSGAVAMVVAIVTSVVPILLAWLFNPRELAAAVFFLVSNGGLPVASAFVVTLVSDAALKRRWDGIFLLLLFLCLLIGCLVLAEFASPQTWVMSGPPLLFLGLLTLLVAPFNWISLGITRALLRRGLELKGWWPYLLALADGFCAAIIVALLALTMVVGVQAFDDLAEYHGRAATLPLGSLLDGIAAHPGSPEFWWVYMLLFSAVIPSLINLMVGGAALMRAVPGLSSLLLRYLPADRAVPVYDRAWIALILTVQVAGGIVTAVIAQSLLAFALILYVMPAAGFGLLDLARDVVAFDLPKRLLAIF